MTSSVPEEIKVEKGVKTPERIACESTLPLKNLLSFLALLTHLKMLHLALPQDYNKVLSRILITLPSTVKQLSDMNFSEILTHIDNENFSSIIKPFKMT